MPFLALLAQRIGAAAKRCSTAEDDVGKYAAELAAVLAACDSGSDAMRNALGRACMEPLLHAAFLAEFRALCPDWRLTVETSLNVAPELLAQCEKAVDEFIVDIKDWDETVYYAYTGHSGAQARENLRRLLMNCPAKVHVRVPLIPQFNTPEQQSASAAALGALGAENIELFSYVLREK